MLVNRPPSTDTLVADNINEIHTIEEELEPATMPPKDKLLRWHYKLGHLSTNCIWSMATQGILPKKLALCSIPVWKAKAEAMETKALRTPPTRVATRQDK